MGTARQLRRGGTNVVAARHDEGLGSAGAPPADPQGQAGPPPSPRLYHRALPRTWWVHHPRYFRFVVREFTAVPISLWLLALLVDVANPASPGAPAGVAWEYVAFSAVCLAFALFHSVTWLGISGLILRIPMGGARDVPARAITGANFAMWGVASLVVGTLLVVLGQAR